MAVPIRRATAFAPNVPTTDSPRLQIGRNSAYRPLVFEARKTGERVRRFTGEAFNVCLLDIEMSTAKATPQNVVIIRA